MQHNRRALTGGGHGDWHSANEALLLLLLHLRLLKVGYGRGAGLRRTAAAAGNTQQILRRLFGRCIAVCCRDSSLPPPFDESHAVPDGLAHYLHITVQEKT